MRLYSNDWKKVLTVGMIAGVMWGWFAMLINYFSGAFPFEAGLLHNMVSFGTGGAVFGIIVSGLMNLAFMRLPFKKPLSKLMFLSVSVWFLMWFSVSSLSLVVPERYHMEIAQSLQGLLLSLMLGGLLGVLWNKKVA